MPYALSAAAPTPTAISTIAIAIGARSIIHSALGFGNNKAPTSRSIVDQQGTTIDEAVQAFQNLAETLSAGKFFFCHAMKVEGARISFGIQHGMKSFHRLQIRGQRDQINGDHA